jgi:hypothetical protein
MNLISGSFRYKCIQEFSRNLKGRESVGDLSVNGWVILRLIKKHKVKVRAVFIWHRITTRCWLYWTRRWTFVLPWKAENVSIIRKAISTPQRSLHHALSSSSTYSGSLPLATATSDLFLRLPISLLPFDVYRKVALIFCYRPIVCSDFNIGLYFPSFYLLLNIFLIRHISPFLILLILISHLIYLKKLIYADWMSVKTVFLDLSSNLRVRWSKQEVAGQWLQSYWIKASE